MADGPYRRAGMLSGKPTVGNAMAMGGAIIAAIGVSRHGR